MIDLLGHIGYVFLILGQWLLTKKSAAGWLVRLGGQAIWIVLGILLGLTSCVIWGIVFVVLDIQGYKEWKRDGEA